MTPSAFYIGVWTQPDFYFNTTDWSKIPQFQKWATRGVNLYFVDTVNPNTAQNTPALYCQMAAAVGGQVLISPTANGVTPQSLVGLPGFFGYCQPDEPESWNLLIKNPDGTYNMDASTQQYKNAYAAYKAADPNAPVSGNFTSGFQYSVPTAVGPATRPIDYQNWFAGADLLSFDSYLTNNNIPVEHAPAVWGPLLARMQSWSGNKPIFNYIETGSINGPNPTNGHGPSAGEYRAEVLVSIILGFEGIIYFPQQINPIFLDDVTPTDVATEMVRIAGDCSTYGQYFLQPSVPLTLPAPFYGCSKTLAGKTIQIILNLSNQVQTYNGKSYAAYDYSISGSVVPPVTLNTLDARLQQIEIKLGIQT